MLETLKAITLEQISNFLWEWYTNSSRIWTGACIVGYIGYKIFGP